MADVTAFQLAMVIIAGLLGVVNIFIGIFLNNIMHEQRSQRVILREIESNYFPRSEFQRFEDLTTIERHNMKEKITALEIRLGDWKGNHTT